ncbi:MAG: c-type cytochrome [Terriglobia bacterium]|nr:c-type cytochrome [Terriglobia bacterium]
MRIRLLFLGLLLIFAFTLFSQQTETPRGRTKPNATAESDKQNKAADMEKAKKLFGYDCAMCHGETGDGKGDLAGDYAGKIKDLTDPATLKDVTDEQIYTLIKDGHEDMPPEGKRAKEDDLRALVVYVRSLAKK